MPGIPPPAGAGGEITQGPHQTVPCPRQPHQLPGDALCAFYDASLNIACRAPLSEDGPQANFATFVEWTLVKNGSPFPACSQENLTSSTPDQVPSPPSPHCAEHMSEPTADGEPEPARSDSAEDRRRARAADDVSQGLYPKCPPIPSFTIPYISPLIKFT